jgi:hypothetical protein
MPPSTSPSWPRAMLRTRRRSPRHPAGDDHEPEPEIAAPVGGNYYVGDADCSLAGSELWRGDNVI